ncbi:hypothetical protein [Streptomyces sp. NPDC058695]|uniref:hypothetical protein n=1 Tax=Streptomyces sp. NPDC058695 TaxID=3346604 RepID=UPI00365CAF36
MTATYAASSPQASRWRRPRSPRHCWRDSDLRRFQPASQSVALTAFTAANVV